MYDTRKDTLKYAQFAFVLNWGVIKRISQVMPKNV